MFMTNFNKSFVSLIVVVLLIPTASFAYRDLGGRFAKPVPDGKGGLIITGLDKCLDKVNEENANVIWQVNLGQGQLGNPAVDDDGNIFMAMSSRYIGKFDNNGNLKWACSTKKSNNGEPPLHNDRVYLTSDDGYFYVFDQSLEKGKSYKKCFDRRERSGPAAPLFGDLS